MSSALLDFCGVVLRRQLAYIASCATSTPVRSAAITRFDRDGVAGVVEPSVELAKGFSPDPNLAQFIRGSRLGKRTDPFVTNRPDHSRLCNSRLILERLITWAQVAESWAR